MNLAHNIPANYLNLEAADVFARIQKIKEQLGDQLLILGHHYQRDEVYQFADITGDSLLLAQHAANSKKAKYIVFCGVHFMAETADIITADHQVVTLPDLRAGCPMADMAPIRKVHRFWQKLGTQTDTNKVIPITYINSSAKIKAFCGEHGGTVCTSSNAANIMKWALAQNKKILFLPDRHLGGNISRDMGLLDSEIFDLDHQLSNEEINQARVLLWHGHCPVHNKFSAKTFLQRQKDLPELQLIAHPECPREVYEIASFTGSTQKIIQFIEQSKPGSKWAIGTETHLVSRLQKIHPDKHIEMLTTTGCMCSMMDRISPSHLLWNLESIINGNPVNQITVPANIAKFAKIALDKMLELSN